MTEYLFICKARRTKRTNCRGNNCWVGILQTASGNVEFTAFISQVKPAEGEISGMQGPDNGQFQNVAHSREDRIRK